MIDFIKPLLTEKNDFHRTRKIYVFEVPLEKTYFFIKQNIELLFGVKVERINFMIRKPKTKRIGQFYGKRKKIKIALVKLKKGFDLDFIFKEMSRKEAEKK